MDSEITKAFCDWMDLDANPLRTMADHEHPLPVTFEAGWQAHAALVAPQQEPVAHTMGRWFECRTIDEMQAFYMSRLPAIRDAAKSHGYAVGLHGSARRDFDLMAMQWGEDCSTPDQLAHAIAEAACGLTREGPYEWEKKPLGRIATSFPVCWTDHSANFPKDMLSLGHIDLSIIGAPPSIALTDEQVVQDLLDWVDGRIDAEVTHRPDGNIYKATLSQTWMQMRRKLLEMKGDGSAAPPTTIAQARGEK